MSDGLFCALITPLALGLTVGIIALVAWMER